METSAKASVNVEEAFHTLARDIKTKTEKKLVSLLKFKYIQYLWVTINSIVKKISWNTFYFNFIV